MGGGIRGICVRSVWQGMGGGVRLQSVGTVKRSLGCIRRL